MTGEKKEFRNPEEQINYLGSLLWIKRQLVFELYPRGPFWKRYGNTHDDKGKYVFRVDARSQKKAIESRAQLVELSTNPYLVGHVIGMIVGQLAEWERKKQDENEDSHHTAQSLCEWDDLELSQKSLEGTLRKVAKSVGKPATPFLRNSNNKFIRKLLWEIDPEGEKERRKERRRELFRKVFGKDGGGDEGESW